MLESEDVMERDVCVQFQDGHVEFIRKERGKDMIEIYKKLQSDDLEIIKTAKTAQREKYRQSIAQTRKNHNVAALPYPCLDVAGIVAKQAAA